MVVCAVLSNPIVELTVPPAVPVVNVLRHGAKAAPDVSLTPEVTSNTYVVFASSRLVGWKTIASPPPVLLRVPATARPSDWR